MQICVRIYSTLPAAAKYQKLQYGKEGSLCVNFDDKFEVLNQVVDTIQCTHLQVGENQNFLLHSSIFITQYFYQNIQYITHHSVKKLRSTYTYPSIFQKIDGELWNWMYLMLEEAYKFEGTAICALVEHFNVAFSPHQRSINHHIFIIPYGFKYITSLYMQLHLLCIKAIARELMVKIKRLKLYAIIKNHKAKLLRWSPFLCLGFLSFQANTYRSVKTSFWHAARFITMLDSSRLQSRCFTADSGKSKDELLGIASEDSRSKRLLFEPSGTSSILEAAKLPYQGCVALAIESADPYVDFRISMEEMVESYGIKDWQNLQELLEWYLKMNTKKNSFFIVEAFADMVTGVSCNCFSSPISCYASASYSKPEDL